jgi:hypothetical protein
MQEINAAEEDWDLLLSFFPPNWRCGRRRENGGKPPV